MLTHPLQAIVTCLFCYLLFVQGSTAAYARPSLFIVSLPPLPTDGLLLNQGWQFQPGDAPDGASPQLNDRLWQSIDPTSNMQDLPQLQQAGIGWLRLHLTTGPELPPTMLYMVQSVASEVYLDGRLLYRFGRISSVPDLVQAYNPHAAFSLPLRPSSTHILAVRVACQTGLDYGQRHLRWDVVALLFRLFPATAVPAALPLTLQASYLDTFKIGIAFILFILHLSLFLAYRNQQANLYAAGMYLLLCLTFLAKTTNSFIHSMDVRALLYYGSLIDSWVPGVVLLTFYTLFGFRKGWQFWLAIGSIGVQFIPLPAGYQWLHVPFGYYLSLELIRLSVVAIRRGLLGARIVTIGAFCNLGLYITYAIMSALHVPVEGNEWLYHVLFILGFLCFPLTLSLRLALEHGWVNGQLMARLQDVETLSARNLAQQQERQQLLARQNEQLEQQVAERTQELHQQGEQLREMDIVKSRFFVNLTHEFRTPLMLILGPTEQVLAHTQEATTKQQAGLVQRNAQRLLRLINQLLDLSKLEAGKLELTTAPDDLISLVRGTLLFFESMATQKQIMLYVKASQDRLMMDIDRDKLEKILYNLFSNALKFTPAGGAVSVAITRSETDADSWVQLTVQDTGAGIPAAKLPYIFNRFYQVDASDTRQQEGTGIGLALTKELVELHGGSLQVSSELGTGTTITVRLPIQLTLSVDGSIEQPSTAQSMAALIPATRQMSDFTEAVYDTGHPADVLLGGTPLVLLIEDNDEVRTFIRLSLSDRYRIIETSDGEAGVRLAQNQVPDLVLTDLMMPRMDGYDVCRLLKQDERTSHIPVLMLTARADLDSKLEGLETGVDSYLAKPFNQRELRAQISNLITRQQKLGEHYRQQFALPHTRPSPSAVKPNPFLLRIYALLDSHLDDPTIGVDWLADQLAMNRKTLYRKLHSLIQLPPADLIRQYRLRKAAELLGAGRNVTETADLVGFSTPSHFSIVFKDFYHQTPSEFITSQYRPV